MTDQIKIMAEPQMNPNECKFSVEQPLYEGGGSFLFECKDDAQGSPLAEALFNVEDVVKAFISSTTIVVTKNSSNDWRTVGPQIGVAIRGILESDKQLISDTLISKLPTEDKIRLAVQKVLDEQINPGVASHGGVIELLDVKRNDIYVRMGGGCQGCSSSTVTLKQGVDQALRREIPELGMIFDTTDHAAGTNPYFSG